MKPMFLCVKRIEQNALSSRAYSKDIHTKVFDFAQIDSKTVTINYKQQTINNKQQKKWQ
mgnify:CR=1 FL=1